MSNTMCLSYSYSY